jgi:hypothetical protein
MRVVADAIGVTTRALYNKIEGRSPFKWKRSVRHSVTLLPDLSKNDLFVQTSKSVQ